MWVFMWCTGLSTRLWNIRYCHKNADQVSFNLVIKFAKFYLIYLI